MSKRSRRIAVFVSILIGAIVVLSVVTDAESEPVAPDKPKVQRVSAKQFNKMVKRERRTTCKIALTRRCYKRRATIKPVSKRAWRVQVRRTHRAEKRWRKFKRTHAWQIAFSELSAGDRAWAYNTGRCESGNNPRANTGNGFYGAFQFVMSTARAAGFTTSPHLTSWHEQAVRAVRWRNIAGRGQWPVCG